MGNQTVSLVLGSGGARGLAHIGVIRYLEESGYEIRSIAGCSIGALIGGVYAVGKLDELAELISAVTRRDVISLRDVSFQGDGLFKADTIMARLKRFLGDALIEDLPIDFTAVASDISVGREVWIDSGPLFDAIRASLSLPLLFTPFPYRGARLFDGGLLNPVPVAPTLRDHTDLKVAVNLGGPPQRGGRRGRRREPAGYEAPTRIRGRVAGFIEDFKGGLSTLSPRELGMFEIAQDSFDAMQSTLARLQLAAYRPDVEVLIPRDTCALLDFDRATDLIALGHTTAARAFADTPVGIEPVADPVAGDSA